LAEINAKEQPIKFVAQFERKKQRWFAIHHKRPSILQLGRKEDNITYCSIQVNYVEQPLLIKGAEIAG
jgi:hypothetical protein